MFLLRLCIIAGILQCLVQFVWPGLEHSSRSRRLVRNVENKHQVNYLHLSTTTALLPSIPEINKDIAMGHSSFEVTIDFLSYTKPGLLVNTEGQGGSCLLPLSPFFLDQLTLILTERADYAHHITTGPPPSGFSDLILNMKKTVNWIGLPHFLIKFGFPNSKKNSLLETIWGNTACFF